MKKEAGSFVDVFDTLVKDTSKNEPAKRSESGTASHVKKKIASAGERQRDANDEIM